MIPGTASPALSPNLLRLFVEAATTEVGAEELTRVLTGANLPLPVIQPGTFQNLDDGAAADLYARLQQALRAYYGHGARGILLRVGWCMWGKMMAEASLREKAALNVLRILPLNTRRRRILETVADRLSAGSGSISVHTLDIDLLLVDHLSASAYGQTDDEPICWVTLGLIQVALYWVTGQETDVEEIACRAKGDPQCEFKIELEAD